MNISYILLITLGGGSVSELSFHNFCENSSILIDNFEVKAIKVQHGFQDENKPFYSNCFRFGSIAYMSDVSEIDEDGYKALKGVKVLILDALLIDRTYKSHFSLPEVLEAVKRIRPQYVYLVGMSHQWDQEDGNELIKRITAEDPDFQGIKISLAYDGLRIKSTKYIIE